MDISGSTVESWRRVRGQGGTGFFEQGGGTLQLGFGQATSFLVIATLGALELHVCPAYRLLGRFHRHVSLTLRRGRARAAMRAARTLPDQTTLPLQALFPLQASQPLLARLVAPASQAGSACQIGLAFGCIGGGLPIGMGHEIDTIDRAGRYAQLTPGALGGDHGMHAFAGPENGIHRTRLNAFGAADALRFAYDRRQRHLGRLLERQGWLSGQLGKARDGLLATRRAAIDRFALGNGLGVGSAAWMPALAALGLRQQGIDGIDQCAVARCHIVSWEGSDWPPASGWRPSIIRCQVDPGIPLAAGSMNVGWPIGGRPASTDRFSSSA
jgi:hypothetical protein